MRLQYLKVLMWRVLAEKKSITIRIPPSYATQVNVASRCHVKPPENMDASKTRSCCIAMQYKRPLAN